MLINKIPAFGGHFIQEIIKLASVVNKGKARVIYNFFKLGKLVSIPTQRKKREIVLAEISKSFKKGKIYAEKEVDEIIHKFHEDHCTIRREMIGCGLMKRENGKYWII